MRIRIWAVFPRACLAFAAGLLGLAASGCRTSAPPVSLALPHPPAFAPSWPSVPGRLQLALVASWLWMDGEYVGRIERLDYVRLLARVRARRAAAGDSDAAKTVELEVDDATDWRNAHHLLGLCGDYERVELKTATGHFSLLIDARGRTTDRDGSNEPRTVVLARTEGVAVWGDLGSADAAPLAAEPQVQKLLDVTADGSNDELAAGLRRVCSMGARCERIVLYFEEGLHGRELLALLGSLQQARASGATPPVISLTLRTPPPRGEEGALFLPRDPDSGRLPLIVIRQVVRGSFGFFLACIEGGLARHPKLAGEVTLRFLIERDGRVSNVAQVGSDLPDEELTQCLIQGFRGLRFPAPEGGVVRVEYPIRLRPG